MHRTSYGRHRPRLLRRQRDASRRLRPGLLNGWAFALAFLVVIPEGDLLLQLSLLFSCHPSPQAEDLLSLPLYRHSDPELAEEKEPPLLPLPLPFLLSSPKGICCCLCLLVFHPSPR
jgi:hypothetical protein